MKNKKRKKKKPLKRSKSGFEAEFLILNEEGEVVFKSDTLLKKLKEKEDKIGKGIRKECAKNEIELGSYPSLQLPDTAKAFLSNVRKLLLAAEEEKLVIFPLGVYPGEFNPQMRKEPNYKIKEKLLGKKKFKIAGRVFGFHYHYELPKGVFDFKKLVLKTMIDSKIFKTLVFSYNFLIAADPALTVFMQSSPFYQGRYLAKDSRVLVYRGDENLGYENALYSDFPQFGNLPPYVQTGIDLIQWVDQLNKTWKELLEKLNLKKEEFIRYPSPLFTNWTPVRISPHGTLEQRGMDMNHILILMAVSFLIRTILKAIQEDFYKIEISPLGMRTPFKLEKKKIIIPPFSYVKEKLQKLSVFKGLESEPLFNYSKKLLELGKNFLAKRKRFLLEPLEKILKERETISDQILKEAKKMGHKNLKEKLSPKIASEIALSHSKRLFKELVLAQSYL